MLPALQLRGIQVQCLVLTWGGTGPMIEQLERMGIRYIHRESEGSTQEKVKWILHQVKENRPDIFVPNLVIPAYFAAKWIRKSGIPTIGILHSDDDFYRAVRKEFSLGSREFAVTTLVCVSRELEQQSLSMQAVQSSIKRIPYGVPIPSISGVQIQPALRIVYVGRLVEKQKQISQVTHALCRAAREVPGVEAVIYGDGEDRDRVEEILRTQESDIAVTLGGRIQSDQIQEKLMDCSVIVLLSDYEGLPIALLEAMACGVVPVCLGMRSGIPELIDDGVTGLLVSDRKDGFVSAIRRLKNEPELLSKLSRAARERVSQSFSIDLCADQWAGLLRQLQESKPKPRELRIPQNPKLPLLNSALAAEDRRMQRPKARSRILLRAYSWADRIKRSAWFRST